MHKHTHTHTHSATRPKTGFPFTGSLHFKMENAQETKQVANQTPMQFGHTVCSTFLSHTLYWMVNNFFSPFFLILITTVAQKAEQTWGGGGHMWFLHSPSGERCPEASHKCLYTTLHRPDDKQGELEVHRLTQGWESAWNHREVVGEGSWSLMGTTGLRWKGMDKEKSDTP